MGRTERLAPAGCRNQPSALLLLTGSAAAALHLLALDDLGSVPLGGYQLSRRAIDAALLHQTYILPALYLRGPDALKVMQSIAVNGWSNWLCAPAARCSLSLVAAGRWTTSVRSGCGM